jgi:hypothetical protein
MFGCDLSNAAITSFSRSSSTFAPTQPFNDTVVTCDAVARSVLACDPAASTAASTTASKAGNISRFLMLPSSFVALDRRQGRPQELPPELRSIPPLQAGFKQMGLPLRAAC